MANSVDLGQTAAEGAVLSGPALLAKTCLSTNWAICLQHHFDEMCI
jgi:hypothetical protein